MEEYHLTKGNGRTRLDLSAKTFGDSLVVTINNENPHIGAVAIGEFDHKEGRASTSVITRPGHKDDAIAQQAAYRISHHTRRPSCVIVGIHLDKISEEEIQSFLKNADSLVGDLLKRLGKDVDKQ